MKKILLTVIMLIVCNVHYGQDIELSYQNAQITMVGMDEFYEVDVFVKADDPFKYGFGQFYITYNTFAFGMSPVDDGDFVFEQPAGSLLDIGIDAAPAAKFFSGFNSNDTGPGIISVNWQHTFAASTIAANTVTATPRFLCRIRLKFVNSSEDPMICFEANLTAGQNAEACGPFSSANPFETADCTNFEAIPRTDDTYDCTGATLPVELCTGGATTFTDASGWLNGPPDATMTAIIEGTYSTETEGNIEACELTIEENASLIINPNNYVRVQGDIINDGTFEVLPQGSLVQVLDDALVTNNTAINVTIETPILKPRDFMIIGSPMTAAIPEIAPDPDPMAPTPHAIFRKLNHTTTNFSPNQEVQMQFPGGTNFVDEEGDDFTQHAGVYGPGEGYYTMPQASLQDGDKTYLIQYPQTSVQGTLNNGIITYAVDYNTGGTASENKNASPSLISNPYPSAISAIDFMAANDAVDELYFWEHNTTPGGAFPGWLSANFTMADISTYNSMGFNPAATGSPTAPTMGDFNISTAQGFGIKNNGSTTGTGQMVTFNNSMRRVDNNNTLRSPDTEIDTNRLWLQITNNEYNIASTILVGFTPEATPEFDPKYDSKRVGTPVSLYSHLGDGSQSLAIQGREAFDDAITIGLGFSSFVEEDAGTYTISLRDLQGISISDTPIYLKDNTTNVITSLRQENYSFTSAAGTFDNRFTLFFKEAEILNNEALSLQNISVYPNPTSDVLHIISPNEILNTVTLTDVLGSVISTQQNIQDTEKTMHISSLNSAIYFLTITTDKGQIIKRVIKE